MAWDKGFDFRGTSGAETDPTNCTYVVAEAYPVTRNGVTFGWSVVPTNMITPVDRNVGNDARIEGINYTVPSEIGTFRVDLPATGTYNISLALGDADGANWADSEIFDNTTSKLRLGPTNMTTNNFLDASNVNRTAATWVSSNVAVSITFASTIFNINVGSAGGPGYSVISHLFISQDTAAGPTSVQLERGTRGIGRGI